MNIPEIPGITIWSTMLPYALLVGTVTLIATNAILYLWPSMHSWSRWISFTLFEVVLFLIYVTISDQVLLLDLLWIVILGLISWGMTLGINNGIAGSAKTRSTNEKSRIVGW